MLSNSEYKDFELIWSLRNTDRSDIKDQNTILVKFESFEYYRAAAKAKYWIFNSNTRNFFKPGKDQIFVQTWHGTPLKKIGCDVVREGNALTNVKDIFNNYTNEAKKISYMIAPSDYCKEKLISAFNLKQIDKEDIVLTTGYPRNDYLFKTTKDEQQRIKQNLNLPSDKKIILYAPTFRDNKYSATEGFKAETHIDFAMLREAVGENCIILFRAHYFVAKRLNLQQYKGFVYDVSQVEDINELYVISDMLITDYSSVFFDYANLKKPIVFYMDDEQEYRNELRDFYIDENQLPGPIVKNMKQLLEVLKQFDLKDDTPIAFNINEKYQRFNNKFNYLDGADTSRKVLEKIIKE